MGIRYSVLGAGAMGSAFGARLHLAGFEVELLNRSPEHGQAIRNNGLLAHIDGNSQRIDIPACTVERARSADVVIIFTKSYQIDAALEKLPAVISKECKTGYSTNRTCEIGLSKNSNVYFNSIFNLLDRSILANKNPGD